MSRLDVIRAWKDPDYRMSLTQAERTQLPAHPAGLVELTDAQIGSVEGGTNPWTILVPIGYTLIALSIAYCNCSSPSKPPSSSNPDGGAPDAPVGS
jgi:mersacidin/lichenicidin family type 2 lantibiotic